MQKKAFTLIELLIVIAIIGILASVVIVKLSKARGRARDVQRMSDLNQIGKALEVYKTDNGAYPVAASWGANDSANWQLLKNVLEPNYFSQVPQDPDFDGTFPWYGAAYHYYSTGSKWTLAVKNETLGFTDKCGSYSTWCCGSWLLFCSH